MGPRFSSPNHPLHGSVGCYRIYHDGWLAHTVHRAAWELKGRQPLLEDPWELYHVDADFSAATDLAAKEPAKLKELQALFLKEAVRNQVLPLDDRVIERVNAALVGRPDLMAGRTSPLAAIPLGQWTTSGLRVPP